MPIYMRAKFKVKREALEICKQTIQEFVDYIHANSPDTILYTSLQEKKNPARFLHYLYFVMKTREIHSNSDAVNRFTSILYPNLLVPMEFTEYTAFASTI